MRIVIVRFRISQTNVEHSRQRFLYTYRQQTPQATHTKWNIKSWCKTVEGQDDYRLRCSWKERTMKNHGKWNKKKHMDVVLNIHTFFFPPLWLNKTQETNLQLLLSQPNPNEFMLLLFILNCVSNRVHISPHWTHFSHGPGTCTPRDQGSSCCLLPRLALVLIRSGAPDSCASVDPGTVSIQTYTHKYIVQTMAMTIYFIIHYTLRYTQRLWQDWEITLLFIIHF